MFLAIYGFSPQILSEIDRESRDDGPCHGAKCLALGLAVEFCEEEKRGLWSKLFGTADKVKLGSRFCLVWEYFAAEDDMAVDDDVACLNFVYRFMFK